MLEYSPMLKKLSETTSFLFIAITGGIVIALGIMMLVLPGPGIIVILIGVAILSKRFSWPKRVLDWVREKSDGFGKLRP